VSQIEYSLLGPILRVKDVNLTLSGNHILRDVNLEIRDIHRPDKVTGQVVGLLGPSGIGKTRLFRILAGLDAPDSGEVLLGEKGEPVARGKVGVVAQHYPLFQHRSILSNLVVAGTLAGLSDAEANARAMDFLKRFGLQDKVHRYPTELSGGQRQRIAIAQQFMGSDYLLLMDEPFSGLDPLAVDSVCSLIQEVASLDTLNTIIVVTHDIAAAMAVSDTLWLMGRDRDEQGRIIPGARVVETINLIERGLAWQENVTALPEFMALEAEIRGRFKTL